MPKSITKALIASMLLLITAFVCGCEDGEPPDHNPAAGLGAIIVDNKTFEDLDLFIEGEFTLKIKDGKDRALDLPPGIYRVILDGGNEIGSYRESIDVLEGRNTILDTGTDSSGDIDVDVFFD